MEFLSQMGANSAPLPTNFRIKPDKAVRVEKIKPLTQAEIKLLQSNIENTYHHFDPDTRRKRHEELKLIFALYYGCGLRRSEGHNLLAKDIDFERKTIYRIILNTSKAAPTSGNGSKKH